MEESRSTSGSVSEEAVSVVQYCADLPVNEDEVPAVGHQTEVGEEGDGSGEEEDVVSSLTMSRPESFTSANITENVPDGAEVVRGDLASANGSWYLYAHCTVNAETRVSPEKEVYPGSVQQEGAVTALSESMANAEGGSFNNNSVDAVKQEPLRNLVNYDSSDSDESSVRTPRIENLPEETGLVFQYPDSDTNPVKTEELNTEEVGASEVRGKPGEMVQEVQKSESSEGYWNSEGFWIDSQGQVWQPQDGYWQEQQWSQQQAEGHEGAQQVYTSDSSQGHDSQGQQHQSRGDEDTQPMQNVEQACSSDGKTKIQAQGEGSLKGSAGGDNNQTPEQYSNNDYYQHQYDGQQSATDSNQQQHYDHERHSNDQSQQQNIARLSDYNSLSSQQSHVVYGNVTDQQRKFGEAVYGQSSYPLPADQGGYSQYRPQSEENDRTQYKYQSTNLEGQPNQAQYQTDSAQSYHMQSYHYDQQSQENSYVQHGRCNQEANVHDQQQPMQQYNQQETQPPRQQEQYQSQSYRPHEKAQYDNQMQNPSFNMNQERFEDTAWNSGQGSEYRHQGQQHSEYGAYGWNHRGGSGGSFDDSHYIHASQQQNSRNGFHSWQCPDKQQEDHNQQYYSQQGHSAQSSSGYYNQPPPATQPSSAFSPNAQAEFSPSHPPPIPPPSIPPPPTHPPHPIPPPTHPPHPIPPPPPIQSPQSFPPPPATPPPQSFPPPPATPPPQSFPPPPPMQSPHYLPPAPPTPHPPPPTNSTHSAYDNRGYFHSSPPKQSWQHSQDSDSYHTNSHQGGWKYYRRDTSQSHGVHCSPFTIPSSPASSDVSSSSRDSPTSVQRSVETHHRSESLKSPSKPVFSQQLSDPRRSSPPASHRNKLSDKSSGKSHSTSSLVHKKTLPQKQELPPSTSPYHAKTRKATKGNISSTEPASFPKSSLSGFRIPKHKRSSEVGKSLTKPEQNDRHTTVELSKNNESVVVAGNLSEAKKEQGINSILKNCDTSDNVHVTTELPRHVRKSTQEEVVSKTSAVEETTVEPRVTDVSDESAQPAGDISQQNLISLFKGMDSNTLNALASTIKLALGCTSTQHDTTECNDTSKQQPSPIVSAELNESSPCNGPTASASVTAQAICTQTDQDVSKVVMTCPTSAKVTQDNSKTVGASQPRMVIATVLSTSVGSNSHDQPGVTEANLSQGDGALTVCIPIMKEKKLQVTAAPSEENEVSKTKLQGTTAPAGEEVVTSYKELKEAEGRSSDVGSRTTESSEKQDTEQDEAKDKSANKPDEDKKPPTLSLLKAQDLMFDPKYMYKEYNLRRVRKQDSSPEQPSPQKKQKLDKPCTKIVSPAASDKGEGRREDAKENVSASPTAENVKRNRSSLTSTEQNEEIPNSKKPREAVEVAVDGNSTEEHSTSQSNHRTTCRVLNFPVSIPRIQPTSSPPPQMTLTQLLAKPTTVEKSNQPLTSPKEQGGSKVEDHSKDKFKKKIPSILHQTPSSGTRLLSNRAQLLCSLCKQKGGVSNMGFLFGPYFCHLERDSSIDINANSSDDNAEVWLHEDCCVWAPGVCLVGRELKGLREALIDANKMVCSMCKCHGATLCCASRGCKNIYHFPCAVEKGCILNEDQFQTNCPKHKGSIHAQLQAN